MCTTSPNAYHKPVETEGSNLRSDDQVETERQPGKFGIRTHNIISGIKTSERDRIEKKSQETKQIVDSDDR
jgi:hypothetical protein